MNPYSILPERAFWKSAVASKNMFDIDELWHPKFRITSRDKVVTFGSCFAQHIGKALKSRGFNWLIEERPPYGMTDENVLKFNYGVFSARTGNIYTTSLLKQWTRWALLDEKTPSEVWVNNERWYDPFRPVVEPGGFESKQELLDSRSEAIRACRDCILNAKVFVFTLGLTESWFHRTHGYEYPMCPGTAAGVYDEELHVFKNQRFNDVIANLREAIDLMRSVNKKLKFVLTVSPVPLTATKSGNNVLVATMESKSILRAVAGQLASARPYVDYFPSYEIINSPAFKGAFFEPNQRNVNPYGVKFVMDSFFHALESRYGKEDQTSVWPKPDSGTGRETTVSSADVCEEELLGAFKR